MIPSHGACESQLPGIMDQDLRQCGKSRPWCRSLRWCKIAVP